MQKAYELCTNSVGEAGNRDGRADYDKLGFVPGSITLTLENAYYDYCAGRFAEALGYTNDARRFFARSQNYRNIYDPAVGNMHAAVDMKTRGLAGCGKIEMRNAIRCVPITC